MAFTAKIADLIADDKTGLLAKHESWKRVRLSEVANILNGAPFDSAKFSASGVPLARIRDVISGQTSTYYTGEYDEAYLLSQGDLLIGMDGDFNTGYWGVQPALLNQRVCKVTPSYEFYNKALLGYVLPGYLAAINANTPSVTVKHLSSKTVGEIELPLPPRAEQSRIVAKLEELLSELDAGVAELKAAQRKLAAYRQSLLKAAVEGTLTADWRAARANDGASQETGTDLLQRILAERRARWEQKQLARYAEQGKTPPKGWQNKYPQPAAPDLANLSDLPAGWTWATIDQLSPNDLANGRSVPTADTGAKVLRLTAVKNGHIDLSEFKTGDWSEEDARPFAVSEGDLLIVRGNGSLSLVGRAGLVGEVSEQIAYPDTLIRLRLVNAMVAPAWVGRVWDSQPTRLHFESRARTSAGIYKISQPDIVSVVVPVPPLDEQNEILALLAEYDGSLRATEMEIAASRAQAAAQRRNILKTAFAGQLVPQDPTDEPASVLLERIRAARAALGPTTRKRGRKARENA